MSIKPEFERLLQASIMKSKRFETTGLATWLESLSKSALKQFFNLNLRNNRAFSKGLETYTLPDYLESHKVSFLTNIRAL